MAIKRILLVSIVLVGFCFMESMGATAKVNCVGAFSYGACSKTCGGGSQTGTYAITKAASGGGAACPHAKGAKMTRACGTAACPKKVDCVGAWGMFGACSKSCGGGSQSAMFSIKTAAMGGGKACMATNGAKKTQACNTKKC